MVIVGNFNSSGNAIINPNLPVAGTWYDLMTGETMNVTNTNMTVSMESGKFKILTNKKIDFSTDINEVKNEKPVLQQSPDNLTIVTDEPVIAAKIYTINGILIKQTRGENTISIANLPKGCYILNAQLNEQNVSFKFIK
jgi:hypothetical protein